MALILFLVTFNAFTGPVVIQDHFECDKDVNSKIKAISSHIKESYLKSDVIEHVEKLEKTLKVCKIDPGKYGWGKGIFEFWKKPSYVAGAKIKYDKLLYNSFFRDITNDAEEYERYLRTSGVSGPTDSYSAKVLIEHNSKKLNESKTTCSKPNKIDRASLGEVRDQDSVGWCYAFTAADLLSYKLKQQISAADIAVIHNDGSLIRAAKRYLPVDESMFNGGRTDDAINKLYKKGACLEKNFLSEDNGYGDLAYNLKGITTFITDKKYKRFCAEEASYIFSKLSFSDIAKAIDTSTNEDIVINLANKACHPRIDISNIKVINKSINKEKHTTTDLFKEIDTQIDSGNIIGINYKSNILRDVNAEIDFSDPKGYHGSSIVDRRFNESTGECEYLIRNSFGRSEHGYDRSLEVTEGNIWMPKSILYKSIYGVTYVE